MATIHRGTPSCSPAHGYPYLYRRCLNREIVVQGNPRVYKALRTQLAAVLDELKRIDAAGENRDELLDNIELITRTLDGMKEERR